ncbi:hypothetical protein BGZ83_002249 [Gryganskiella cystojenkinii]|nr:hypothetical protein BGZ83_002249 [Gryganskiella cystojenkinii]
MPNLESRPDEVDRPISEVTFTVKYVAPKPDRPDILVKAYRYEIMYGEITGPCRTTCEAKTNWDMFRLARFGKTFLDNDKGLGATGASSA